jgi:hypothetical protein
MEETMRLCEHPKDVLIGGGAAFTNASVSDFFKSNDGRDKAAKLVLKTATFAKELAVRDGNAKAAETAGKVESFVKTGRDVFGFFNVLAGSLWNGCLSLVYELPQTFMALFKKDVVVLTDSRTNVHTTLKPNLEKSEMAEKKKVNPFGFASTSWQKVAAFSEKFFGAIGCWAFNVGFGAQKPISMVKKFTKVDEGAAKFGSGFAWTMAVNNIAAFMQSFFGILLACNIFAKVETGKLSVAQQKKVAQNFGTLVTQKGMKATEKAIDIAADANLYGAKMSPLVHASLGFVGAFFGIANIVAKSAKLANKM